MGKRTTFLLTKTIGFYLNAISHIAPALAFKKAYFYFSHPRSGKLHRENLPQVLLNAQHETLEVNDHQVQTYLWPGNNKVILLLHGWESNSARWEPLLSALLETGSTVVALDAPGHGLTSGREFNVPLYATFVEAATQKFLPTHIIGHSMGGITAAYYQHRYASPQLEKMVLLGTPSDFSIILHNYLKLLGLNKKIKKAFYDYTVRRFQIEIEAFSGKEFVKTAQIQGLIIHDLEDTVVRFEEAKKLAENWSSAQLISTSGLGHSLHDEAVHQQIVAFLSGA